MSKSAKEIVKGFYNRDFLNDHDTLEDYIHPEIVLIWNSTEGLTIMRIADLVDMFKEIKRTYVDLRMETSHVLEDGNHVTIRYKYYVRTIENPDEELGIAHFIAIWEVKDGKLFRGHQISQPVMSIDDTSGSYDKVKV
ncbi:nuclear transport factor 2 family protein [Patiriisocius sp. Uisw_017]|jgi:ketosteroid isomerase-like protein|uniref:nuclear transport factor 2 family protein n=1 Tax=Patiriisocius sp. Uisw_017 TaxID=3230968 RepID=UPI0039ED7B99